MLSITRKPGEGIRVRDLDTGTTLWIRVEMIDYSRVLLRVTSETCKAGTLVLLIADETVSLIVQGKRLDIQYVKHDRRGAVRLALQAPDDIVIVREELCEVWDLGHKTKEATE